MASEIRRPAPDWCIEQLQEHFGMIPWQRIRLHPAPGTATEEDALICNERDGDRCELIDGTLVARAVGLNESRIALVLGYHVHNFLDIHPLGDVTGERGLLRVWPFVLRSADLSFFLFDSLPGGEIPDDEAYPHIVPDFALEVLRRENTPKEIERKLKEFFGAGTKIMWFIDPHTATARVHRSPPLTMRLALKGCSAPTRFCPAFRYLSKNC